MASYETMVQRLAEMTEKQKVHGVNEVYKGIPDLDRTGDLDPRVLADAEHMPDRENEEVPSIETIRENMGRPNQDVTKSTVSEERMLIPAEHRSIPAVVYTPEEKGPRPVIVYFFGGGFIGGSVEAVANPCKALAEKAGAVVVSVDYRLAPEHPYPAAVNDSFAAVEWVHARAGELGADQNQITVAGDSAGGNLATVCALLDKERGTGMIAFQALLYPVVHLTYAESKHYTWSLDRYQIHYHPELVEQRIRALEALGPLFRSSYLQGTEPDTPYVSPLAAEDVSGMPPALIFSAEYDFLRLEEEAYAEKLAAAGVPVTRIQYQGMDHGYIDKIGGYPQAEDTIHEIAKAMQRLFS
ncbi:alpha/beta hydrolase [Salibacterium qingdaonense]|uniref:Acetyl esterase/lipase n=1 Tax=Salibacterium qingdaonense TaxID=266892 RepID=A0A1I4NSK2_9BACI|nr:alpha/beta hydrolase [Salibacterium qingdaonense]SFM18375.1 Acetyl esterase/lipase [Salibacterium qingdaonense]